MSSVIGIDLGTTNTVVAAVRDAQASALADEQGQVLIPSVVSFHPNGNVIVGRAARDRRLIDPSNTIYSVKRLIGRSWDSEEVRRARARFPFQMREGPGQAALVVARGETYTLPEISAFVLRKAKSVAEAALGTTVERAVITVPANFNDLQRAATKVAGRVAGLEVMRILNEPTAAALAYGYGKASSERVAVYDFGGGTFDVTLLDLSDNVFEVLATSGNSFLGGDDIDLVLAERMSEQLLAQHRYDARADPLAFEQIRLGAESIKHQLSTQTEARVEIEDVVPGQGGKPIPFVFSMTRNEFDRLINPIVDRTFDVCREALSIARLSPSDFEQVLLVGGSTRIPLVRRRVEEFFNRPVKSSVSPDEVVAIGAAIQANALSGAERRAPVPPAPNPAAAGKRRAGTLPPGVRARMNTAPGVGGIPDTQPFAGRARMATSPGIAPGSASAKKRPSEPAEPALGVFGRSATATTDPGPAGRERAKTGPGLGPSAQVARGVPGPTLLSASDAALRARQQAEAGTDIPLPLVGPDSPPEQPASPTAKYGDLPLTMPGPATRTEESVIALADADVTDLETTDRKPGLRALAAPLSSPTAAPQTGRTAPLDAIDDDDEPTRVGEPKGFQGKTMLGGLLAPQQARLAPQAPTPPPLEPLGQAPIAPPAPPLVAQPAPPPPPPFEPEVPAPPPWLTHEAEPAPAEPPRSSLGATLAAGSQPSGFGVVNAPVPGAVAPPAAYTPADTAHGFGTAPMEIAEPARMPLEGAPPRPPVLVDVTPLTLSVETVDGFCDAIIERNATVPCERTRDFVTATDNQTTVRIRVSQGESSRFAENTLLGEVELSGLRPAPRGQVRISVTFALDASGMMIVSAKEVATGRATTTRVRLVGLPDSHQLAHMMSRHAARQTV